MAAAEVCAVGTGIGDSCATLSRVKTALKAFKTAQKSAIRGVSANYARRLSYQAWQSRRNVRMSDMPVCGDRQFVIDF